MSKRLRLFRNEYAALNECPKCGASRYKKKLSPAKVLWYFPIIPRFRRMYRSETDSRHLTWHVNKELLMESCDIRQTHHNGGKLILIILNLEKKQETFGCHC